MEKKEKTLAFYLMSTALLALTLFIFLWDDCETKTYPTPNETELKAYMAGISDFHHHSDSMAVVMVDGKMELMTPEMFRYISLTQDSVIKVVEVKTNLGTFWFKPH